MNFKTIATTLFSILFIVNGFSQTQHSPSLTEKILKNDSLLFNVGFNNCDLTQFENLISDDFEFYHDKAGVVKSKSDFISSIKTGVCNNNYKAIRLLDSTKTEVFPLYDNGKLYGTIQNGVHSFYAQEESNTKYITSIAKFTHVWRLENEVWKLNRSLSYDHKHFDKPINKSILFKDKHETERWLKQKNIPTLGIGYIEDGKINKISVFGELEKGKKAPKNTIWNVASLTKPIVTLITLKLVNSGQWNLDEPIYKYWIDPDVKEDKHHKQLTTRHILSHQTGFKNWRWHDETSQNKLKFYFEPGSNYQYSGEGFEYLKKALENKFKCSLNELADSLIFKPLKMDDTRFYWDKKMDESRFAKWHSTTGEVYETHKTTEVSAADDLLTTVADYTTFIQHILNGADLSTVLQKELTEEQVRINSLKYWGLGFWIDENINKNSDIALVHGGDDIGVHTIAFMIPNTKQGLVIFTNSDNGTAAFMDVILHYLKENAQGVINAEMK